MRYFDNDYYVYEQACPESMGGAVFYVGKGRGDRINDHEREARRGHQCQKCNIIRSIWEQGEQVMKRKIYTGLSHDMALRLEDETIVHYGLENLTNRTRKGEKKWVTPGFRARRSQETKAKWTQRKAAL